MMPRAKILAVLALLGAVVAVACSDGTAACYPGDYVACTCADGANGYALCGGGRACRGAEGANGSALVGGARAFGACDCGPPAFLPDGGPPEASTDDSGLLPF